MASSENRPWGSYDILSDAPDCKVKIITVKPQQRISYQFHYKRSEHWVVVSGAAHITLEDASFTVPAGQHVFIPTMAKHRIENTSETEDLVFVEVQCGTCVYPMIIVGNKYDILCRH